MVMGGAACTVGNITPAAEYNIWFDPEAARICFRSGLPIEMVGWELCRGDANLSDADMRHCREVINTPLSHFAVDCNKAAIAANRSLLSDPALPLPDPVTMAIAIDPTICTRRSKHNVEVECEGVYTRGMTVVDQLGITANGAESVSMWQPLAKRGEPNATVCWEIDIPRWKELLYKTMRVSQRIT
jgi:purine nucleosidase